MEIINLLHPGIIDKHNINQELRGNSFVRVSKKDIYFSTGAVKEYHLVMGLRIHFIKDGKDWMFYMNDDIVGFQLTKKNKNSLRITNVPMTKMIRGEKLNVCFRLELTEQSYYDRRIIKMIPI